jgi:hypothetical protein
MAAAAPTTHCALAVIMGMPPVETLAGDDPLAEALDADAPEASDEPEALDDELEAPVDFEPEELPVAVALALLGELARAPAVMVTGTGESTEVTSSKAVVSTEEKDETPSLPTAVALQTPEELSVITHPTTTDLEECEHWVHLMLLR